MYRAALKNSERTRRHSVSAYQTELLLSECPATPEAGQMKGRSRIHRKRSSNSSISALFFREEGRAVKTGVIVISSFITSWMPYYAYKILESVYCFFPHLQNFVILMSLSSSCTMPFIYVYRNETARKEALRVVFWWRDIPSTPTYLRPPMQPSNGNSPLPVMEPKPSAMYSYTTECEECGANQLVTSLKSYRPMSTPIHELRRQPSFLSGRENAVSFRLSSYEKPSPRCDSCFRQDSGSSASSDDPLIGERFRFPRHNLPPTAAKLMRHRLSNGSVNARSDSLASTNSSVLSYSIHKWPRRCSTVSIDSAGGTPQRKISTDESHYSSVCETPKIYLGQYLKDRKTSTIDIEEDESGEIFDVTDYHGYGNFFQSPFLYSRDEHLPWTHRYIWEIEECDGADEDSVVVEKETLNYCEGNQIPSLSKEMEDIQKLRDVRRSQMLRKRYSEQEFSATRSIQAKRFTGSAIIKPIRNFSKDFTLTKFLKNEENRSLRIKETDLEDSKKANNNASNILIETEPHLSYKQSDL